MTVIHSALSDSAILCLNSTMGIIYFHFKSHVDISDVQENLNSPYTQRIRSFISLLYLKRLNPGSFLYPACITPFEEKCQHLKGRGSSVQFRATAKLFSALPRREAGSGQGRKIRKSSRMSSLVSVPGPWLGAAQPNQAAGARNFAKQTKPWLCLCHQGASAWGFRGKQGSLHPSPGLMPFS